MSRRDDINKLYQPSKALEKVCYALFTADIAISLIAACVGGSVISYLTVALVIIAFLYMAISIIDDGIMWFQAESARRKNSIQVAYDVRLDEYETEKYYNNNVGDPDISYATNLFESAFFTNGMFGQPASMSQTYMEYAVMRRSSSKIAAALREAKPKLSIRAAMLDGDPLILNTPDGEIHLDTGEMSPHEPEHFITHMTSCAPSDDGADIWDTFLHQIACNDETLVAFLKQIAGMAAIGKVYEERLGSGGNGKSTFFNAIQDVMGDYACTIRSELLVASNDSGKKFELARLRGKRLAIAEELEEGRQLDTAEVKHLCSTGDINAQFKGKDVFTFKPSHSIVLCTNHMPSVKVMDSGTWDRLIVVPFRGRFRSQENEIKNYGNYLVRACGGAILSWIIDGAREYIRNDYKLDIPECIISATEQYQQENDWLTDFFNEWVALDKNEDTYGSDIYGAYTSFCSEHGERMLPMSSVLPLVEKKAGATKKRTKKGNVYQGLRIISEFERAAS